MKSKLKKIFIILLFTIVITSCTSKITKANFDQIQNGMTLAEVIAILGQPSSSSTLGIGDTIGTSATWENRNGVVSIQFFNGRVKIKQFIEGVSTPRKMEW